MMKHKKVKFTTTLKLLKQQNPCSYGLQTLLKSLPKNYSENKQINLLHILGSNGVDHFFWALRAVKTPTAAHKKVISYILADIIESVEPNFSKEYPDNTAVRNVIKYLRKGTKKQLKEAQSAAFLAALSAVRPTQSAAEAEGAAAVYSALTAGAAARLVLSGTEANWSRLQLGQSGVRSLSKEKQKEIIRKYLTK